MLRPFRVLEPSTAGEAAAELGRLGERAKVYAGGAELLLLLRHKLVQAGYLVNIKRIGALDKITWDGGILRIGATVTHHRLEKEPLVQKYLPMFAHAESQVANLRVRNQGTLGGNLCFNDPHSDPGPALLVYEASVKLAGASEERLTTLDDFFVDMYATTLRPDEVLTEVQVPPLPAGFSGAYARVHRFQRPTVAVAAAVKIENGRLDNVRLAVGCVGPKPQRLQELEAKIRGISLKDAQRVISQSGPYFMKLLRPVDDLLGSADYKLYMTRTLLARALEEAPNGDRGAKSAKGD